MSMVAGSATPRSSRSAAAISKGPKQSVDDVAGLLLVQLDRNHTNLLGECDDPLVHTRIGVGRTHHLGNVVDPDVVGEVQR
jgi:hypothetical protein